MRAKSWKNIEMYNESIERLFKESLLIFIEKLKSDVVLDEWYLAEFIELNIDKLSAESAFNLASYVIHQIVKYTSSDLLYELLQILLSLQRQSGTMQKPLALLEYPDIFNQIISHNSNEHILETVKALKLSWCY